MSFISKLLEWLCFPDTNHWLWCQLLPPGVSCAQDYRKLTVKFNLWVCKKSHISKSYGLCGNFKKYNNIIYLFKLRWKVFLSLYHNQWNYILFLFGRCKTFSSYIQLSIELLACHSKVIHDFLHVNLLIKYRIIIHHIYNNSDSSTTKFEQQTFFLALLTSPHVKRWFFSGMHYWTLGISHGNPFTVKALITFG